MGCIETEIDGLASATKRYGAGFRHEADAIADRRPRLRRMHTRVAAALVLLILPAPAQEKGIDRWIAQLEAGDVAQRREAVYEIWKLKERGKRATAALAYALCDKDDYVRETAARGLEPLIGGAADAIAPLEQALRDERVAVRRDAARLMAMIGPETIDAMESLRAALRDPDPEVRRHAASAFSHFGPKGAAAAAELERLLKEDPDAQVRSWAANALSAMGTPPSCAPTLLAALKDKEGGVQERALAALQVLWPEVQIPVETLLAMLKHESATTRSAAAMALKRHLDDPKVQEALIVAASDPEPWAAGSILDAIGSMKPPPERAILAVAARLGEERVRASAIFALMKVGPAAAPAVPALLTALATAKDETGAILLTIGGIGPAAKEAVPALRERLAAPQTHVALAAAGALQRVAGEGLEAITAALADPERARPALAELGRLGPAAAGAAPALRNLLKDEGLRRDAAIALFRISGAAEKEAYAAVLEAVRTGDATSCRLAVLALRDRPQADESSVTALVEALKARDDGIRYHVAEALRNLGHAARSALPALREVLASARPPVNIVLKEAVVAAH